VFLIDRWLPGQTVTGEGAPGSFLVFILFLLFLPSSPLPCIHLGCLSDFPSSPSARHIISTWAHRSRASKMSPTQSGTFVVQKESPRGKSMIPISNISRLWKPSKEPDTSSPGSSKIPRRVTRSPKSKEQHVLPEGANAISQKDDPFTAGHSPLRSKSSKLPSRARF
jgi:hypothetical protein